MVSNADLVESANAEWRGGRGTHLAGVAEALVERARGVVAGHVPLATEDVVDVLAELRRVRAVLARADAELVERHEVLHQARRGAWEVSTGGCKGDYGGAYRPFVRLLELAERAREDEPADRVACRP